MTVLFTPAPPPGDALADNDLAAMAASLMQSRQTILPKRLAAPGPDAGQLALILNAAATAPDHGQLLPWRFVLVPQAARAPAWPRCLARRWSSAMPPPRPRRSRRRAKKRTARRCCCWSSWMACAATPDIDLPERIVSAGCAVQNMLLMATALGYGSALTSGKALKSAGLRTLFGLAPGEQALCFVSIGTVQSRKTARLRPAPADFVTTLSPGGGSPTGF